MSQKYAAYDSTGAVVAFYDSVLSPVPAGVSAIEITDAQWQTCLVNPGWTVAGGALVAPVPPTAAALLAVAQAAQVAVVTAAYQSAVQQPVAFTNKAGTAQTYQADATSQQLLMQATQGYTIGGSVPDGFYWKASDNTHVPFVLADLQGLYDVMLAQGWAAFQKLQTLKTSIAAATTVDAVQAVVWAN
jgi:hypothetical protein